jgi:hypothetical protein
MIRYDQCSSRITLPEEVSEAIFEDYFPGWPISESTTQEFSEWAAANLRSHWGFAMGMASRGADAPPRVIWFEDVREAIHFKMRWY